MAEKQAVVTNGFVLKPNVKREIVQFIGILAGAFIFAISYSWFLVPYKVVPGGVGGIAQILFFIFDIPVGMSIVMINIPLFILGFLILGKTFGVRSFLGMFISAALVDLTELHRLYEFGILGEIDKYAMTVDGVTVYTMLPNDVYLSAIAGSVLLGVGLGLMFRFRSSTGGTDIPVAVIKQKFGVSIGTGYWIVETLIILTVGIVFHDMKLIIWGYINLFITAKITDLASEGLPYVKGVYIISEKWETIKQMIYKRLDRGVTLFHAEGGYSGVKRPVLFCVMNRRQVSHMRDIVKDIDPKAFMILTDVNDVMGYGFKTRNLDLAQSDSASGNGLPG